MGHGTATIDANHWPARVTGLVRMADALSLYGCRWAQMASLKLRLHAPFPEILHN